MIFFTRIKYYAIQRIFHRECKISDAQDGGKIKILSYLVLSWFFKTYFKPFNPSKVKDVLRNYLSKLCIYLKFRSIIYQYIHLFIRLSTDFSSPIYSNKITALKLTLTLFGALPLFLCNYEAGSTKLSKYLSFSQPSHKHSLFP